MLNDGIVSIIVADIIIMLLKSPINVVALAYVLLITFLTRHLVNT